MPFQGSVLVFHVLAMFRWEIIWNNFQDDYSIFHLLVQGIVFFSNVYWKLPNFKGTRKNGPRKIGPW